MLVPSCGWLDQDPGGMNTIDKVFASASSTKEWYARMYSDDFMVQEMHYSGQIPYFWCTDEAAYTMEGNIKNTAEGLMSPDNYYGYTGYNLYFFVRYYQAIRHINLFLENLDKCKEMGELERRTKRAEATFMRAYYHYLLLRLYGPIPVMESSRTAEQLSTPQARKPFMECVQWISDQIDWAIENGMPTKRNESLELGLPDVAAARAIQSRLYLMAASPLYNGNTIYASWTNRDGTVLIPQKYDKELWKEAADRAKDIIDNYGFSLKQPKEDATFDEVVENLRTITTTWGAEVNPEVIWAHPNSIQWYGMCALPGRWFGWNGRYSLAIGMVNDFYMADGTRARPVEEWFEDKKFSTEAGNGTIANTFWMFCGREPRFYANIHFPNQRVSYANPSEPDTAQDADGYGVVDASNTDVYPPYEDGKQIEIFSNGKYIKTIWKKGDLITTSKLNKIEEAIETLDNRFHIGGEPIYKTPEIWVDLNNIVGEEMVEGVSYEDHTSKILKTITDRIEVLEKEIELLKNNNN